MNLWDKALKLALVLVPTLFFLACDEELSNVGENGNGNQFELLFEEFTLPSHVIIDSMLTNNPNLLVGSYIDSEFGTVSSTGYLGLVSTAFADLSDPNIVLDSIVLSLKPNAYYYGSNTNTSIDVSVHELTEQIIDVSNSTNYSTTSYDPMQTGEAAIFIEPELFDTYTIDSTDVLNIRLNESYFQKVKDIVDASDSGAFKLPETSFGFAINAPSSGMLFGVGIIDPSSRLTINYHTVEAGVVEEDSLEYSYNFYSLDANFNIDEILAYNGIDANRLGTPIANLLDEQPNTPFIPDNGKRYFQSGTGITTEIDFRELITFFEDKDHMIINSAEISFGVIENTENFASPEGLSLSNTNDNSEIASLEILGTNFPTIQSDLGTQFVMPYEANDDNSGKYFGLPTRYFQFLYDSKIERSTVVVQGVDFSGSTILSTAGYTVDRFVVHQDSIKLKVFYTLPK